MDPFQSVINNNVRRLVGLPGFDVNSLDEHGKSLLDYAVANGNVEIATLLRGEGANVTQKSELLEQLLGSTEESYYKFNSIDGTFRGETTESG